MSHPARAPRGGIDGKANAASRRRDERLNLYIRTEAAN
jgi:hypothetical protein